MPPAGRAAGPRGAWFARIGAVRLGLGAGVVAGAAGLAGCVIDWTVPPPEGTGGGGATGTTGTATGSTSSTMTSTGTTGGGGAGPCSMDLPCSDGAYCDFPDDRCGETELGTCVAKPQACPADTKTCGCDGMVYDGACGAASAGFDVAVKNGCALPNHIACGPLLCDITTTYCEEHTMAATYVCTPLPPACTVDTTCDCIGADASCSWTGDTGVGCYVTCSK